MQAKVTILIIEDEKNICDFIATTLKAQGYKTITTGLGREGISLTASQCPDVILLDLGLPDVDGMEVIRQVRSYSAIPIIVISARTQEKEKVMALDLGADDYLIKPFDFDELLARIRVLTRKRSTHRTSVITISDLKIDTGSHSVIRGARPIELSSREYAILEYMALNQGRVLSREQIEDHVWNFDYSGGTNVVDVYISYLRKKIDSGEEKKLIRTVWGTGWMLKEDA